MVRSSNSFHHSDFAARLLNVPRALWRWLRSIPIGLKLLMVGLPIFAVFVLGPLMVYAYFSRDIDDPKYLMNRNSVGVVLLDQAGEEFYRIGRLKETDLVPLEQIADVTEKALIAAEDKNFYKHNGFSFISILKAVYGNFLARGTTYGGSTLTQQLAKNTLLTSDRTYLRKYQELVVSVAIERRYTKDQILNMYLNSVYFGEDAFGIEDAAKTYFNKSPAQLNLAESALLVGLLPAPSAYSPISGDEKLAKKRQETVLARMADNGSITESEKKTALAQPLAYENGKAAEVNRAPHFALMVLKEIYKKYGEENVQRSGFQVKTTLDLNVQKVVEDNITRQLPYIRSQGGTNASAVVIDPTNGQIRALAGSADWDNQEWGKVNMATTPRQPGSSFKPIYYTQALADGVITPATILKDEPTDFGNYEPLNADRRFRGRVSVRSALAQSLNIPSVKVMEELGLERAVDAANRLGIKSIKEVGDRGLSLALGSAEVPLLEMASAYATLAAGGQYSEPTLISEIQDKYDNVVYRGSPNQSPAISQQGAFLISDILSDNASRAPIFGSSLTVPGDRVAVKTGTTDQNVDAWTIGYTKTLVMGVWVGNNNNAPMKNGGSGMAGPIFVRTMTRLLDGKPANQFMSPDGIVRRLACANGGGIATRQGPGTYNEYFLAWALPKESCTPINPVKTKPREEKKPDDEKKDEAGGEEEKNTGTGGSIEPPALPLPPSPTQTQSGNQQQPVPENGGSQNGGGGNGAGSESGRNPEDNPTPPPQPVP